jgi:hypothetical protein
MKKTLLSAGVAMLCLLGSTAFVSGSKPVKKPHHKMGKLILTASGAYYNSNSFPITVFFKQYGHPINEFTIPTGYSSGMYTAPIGTYDVEFLGSGSAEYMVSGQVNQTGSDVTFPGIVFTSTSQIIFEAETI